MVNYLVDKIKGTITREKHSVNDVEKSIIDFVLMSNDLVKHIEHIHVDNERVHVLSKNIKKKLK